MFYFLLILPVAVVGFMDLNAKSGPYDIEIHKFEACANSGTAETVFSTRITKVSREKYVYTGDFRLGPQVDEQYNFDFELQQFSNGGYTPRYMLYTVKGCEQTLKLAKENLQRFFKAAGVTLNGCPLPTGNFTVKDFELEVKGVVPFMIYGKYRMITNFLYKDVKVGCLVVYAEAVPKNAA